MSPKLNGLLLCVASAPIAPESRHHSLGDGGDQIPELRVELELPTRKISESANPNPIGLSLDLGFKLSLCEGPKEPVWYARNPAA